MSKELTDWELSFLSSVMNIVRENKQIFNGISPDHKETLSNILDKLAPYVDAHKNDFTRGQEALIKYLKEGCQKIVDNKEEHFDAMADVIQLLTRLKPIKDATV